MLGFHIYVGLMEGNPCFFRINACFTTFCDPITSGCQGFQEWIALYSTSNKLVQAQTRASPNEDEIGYQYTHKRRVLFWIGKHPASRITFQKSKKPKIRLISQELSVFVPDQSTFSYLVAFLPPCFFGRGETAWDIERVSTQSFSSPFCSAASLAKPKSHLQAEADWWKASWLFHHQSMHLMINGVPQFSGIKI